jgi:hypothetical protein
VDGTVEGELAEQEVEEEGPAGEGDASKRKGWPASRRVGDSNRDMTTTTAAATPMTGTRMREETLVTHAEYNGAAPGAMEEQRRSARALAGWPAS